MRREARSQSARRQSTSTGKDRESLRPCGRYGSTRRPLLKSATGSGPHAGRRSLSPCGDVCFAAIGIDCAHQDIGDRHGARCAFVTVDKDRRVLAVLGPAFRQLENFVAAQRSAVASFIVNACAIADQFYVIVRRQAIEKWRGRLVSVPGSKPHKRACTGETPLPRGLVGLQRSWVHVSGTQLRRHVILSNFP